MDRFCSLCFMLVCVVMLCLSFVALWSSAGKGCLVTVNVLWPLGCRVCCVLSLSQMCPGPHQNQG